MWMLLLAGVGGFLGSAARFAIGGLAQRWVGEAFPAGTLLVNVVGCLAIGAAACAIHERGLMSAELRVFLVAGVLGGFTTFSAFGYETLMLARGGDLLRAGLNVLANVTAGILAVWLGWQAWRALSA